MKDCVTSVRLSSEQKQQIQENAKRHHMSFNDFLVISALRSEAQFTPVQSVHMQNIINIAVRLAKEHAPELLNELQEEENAIWFL